MKKTNEQWLRDLKPMLQYIERSGGKALEANIIRAMSPKPRDTIYAWLRVASDRFKLVKLDKEIDGHKLGKQNAWVLINDGN